MNIDTNKKLDIICNQLQIITASLENLNTRINKLENKTNDIHKYVPFVGWLENVGRNLVKWSWIKNIEEPPLHIENNIEEPPLHIENNIEQ